VCCCGRRARCGATPRRSSRSCSRCYITVDIDAIDQAFAPGTSVPATNGLYPYEVTELLFCLASRHDVFGFDLTEVSPPLDPTGATVALAADLIHHLWAGIARRRS
jgi:agmatinase